MRNYLLALSVLALSALACGQYVGTPTPTASPVLLPSPTVPPPTPSPAATEAEQDVQTATVRAAVVNVRAKPDGDVIGNLEAGDTVTVVGCGTDPEQDDYQWCHIEHPFDGYVFQGCLSGNDDLRCEARP